MLDLKRKIAQGHECFMHFLHIPKEILEARRHPNVQDGQTLQGPKMVGRLKISLQQGKICELSYKRVEDGFIYEDDKDTFM